MVYCPPLTRVLHMLISLHATVRVSVYACCAGCGRRGLLLSSRTFQESGGRRSPEMTLQIQLLAFHLLLTETWLDTGPAFLRLEPDVVLTHSNIPTRR